MSIEHGYDGQRRWKSISQEEYRDYVDTQFIGKGKVFKFHNGRIFHKDVFHIIAKEWVV